jgi:hypothetical protein
MIIAMTLSIILTVSLVMVGALLYLGQYVSKDGSGRSQAAGGEVVRTGREQLQFLWHRLGAAVSEMNYAARRIVEVQARPLSDGHPNH